MHTHQGILCHHCKLQGRMDDLERSWYELKFSREYRDKSGNAFQDFFSDVMERRYPGDFQRVRPYGTLGDRKCDGYHSSLKVVYQLYAPEVFKLAAILSKIEEDFSGALAYWKDQMLGWRFVHNQWRGLPADVISDLVALETKNKIPVSHWGEPELKNEVFQLPYVDLAAVLGYAPTRETVSKLGIEDLRPVIEALASQQPPTEAEIKPVPQDKLDANGLSQDVRLLLVIGMQKSSLVQRFFLKWHDPLLGDRIAKTFRKKYEDLKAEGIFGDNAFLELWSFAGGSQKQFPKKEAAVLAVLAFLFEECEIFEPSKGIDS